MRHIGMGGALCLYGYILCLAEFCAAYGYRIPCQSGGTALCNCRRTGEFEIGLFIYLALGVDELLQLLEIIHAQR
jgi:hypothetical protein